MRNLIDKFYHNFILRDNVYKYYSLFKKSQYWKKEKLVELIEKHL